MLRPLVRLLGRYARWSCGRPGPALLVVVGTAALCLLGARRIGLDASFEALLPEHTPSVQAREEVRRRVGSSDLYVIAIRSPDPVANHRFAEAVRERIEAWPETVWVMSELDLEPFRDRALLYMDLDDLRQLVDLVELRVARAMCESRGDCAETDLRTAEEAARDERRLRDLGRQSEERLAQTAGDREELARTHPELRDALMNPAGTVAVVMARLTQGTNDIEAARELMLRGEALVAELGPRRYNGEMVAMVAGAYRSLNEFDTVLRDATTASLVSFGLIFLVTIVLFRRLRAVLIIAGSLAVGLLWTVGLVGVTLPVLNTITAVIFGILLGMGIDYPIHLIVATRAARGPETSLPDAVAEAVRLTLPAMIFSALTTAAALLTLVVAQNRGFREFGIMGSYGVILCLLAAVAVTPPLLGLFEKVRPGRKPLKIPSDRWVGRHGPWLALGLGGVLSALLVWRAPELPFEYNLSNLSAPNTGTGIGYGDALRTGRGTTPMVLLGDDEAELRRAHEILTERRDAGDDRILDVITIETFVPSHQEEKLEEIDRLRGILNPRLLRRVPARDRGELEHLAHLAEVDSPIRREDLPGWAQRMLVERDGSFGRIGLVYTGGRNEDAREAMRFSRDYGALEVGGARPLRAASPRFVIADVVYTMIGDGERMVVLAVIAIVLLLAADLRSLSGVALSVLSLGLGLSWAFGLAEWLGWKLGVFNMLVIPVALGLGIDGAIHVYHRYRRDPTTFATSPLGVTGFAVLASSLTTVAGFSGLLFVSHRGLATIGQLAVAAVGLTLAAVLGVLPGALVALARRAARRGR